MKSKKKSRKVIISTMFLFLICLVTIITVCNFSNIKTFYYETNYKTNSSVDNLNRLCLNIRFTKNYDKKIEYLPKLLYNDKAFNGINKFLSKNSDINAVYDELQCEYIFSYLFTG